MDQFDYVEWDGDCNICLYQGVVFRCQFDVFGVVEINVGVVVVSVVGQWEFGVEVDDCQSG